MKIRIHLFFLVLFNLSRVHAEGIAQEQSESRFFLSLQGTLSSRDLVATPQTGVKLKVGFATLAWLISSASYSTTSIPRQYENISGTATTDLAFNSYRVHLAVPILKGNTSFCIDGSAGIAAISSEPMTLSLGALGSRTFPAQQETFLAYAFGLLLRQRISGRVALEIEPEALFLPSSSSVGNIYSIGGGLNIGIL